MCLSLILRTLKGRWGREIGKEATVTQSDKL